MRVAYLYLMRDDPRVVSVAGKHAAYWHALDVAAYEGGPFADRSGGLIVFACYSLQQARRYVSGDPFVEHDLLSATWLKQWSVEPYPPLTRKGVSRCKRSRKRQPSSCRTSGLP